MSPRTDHTLRRLLLLALVVFLPSGCRVSVSPDKRIQQYLNQYGFGKRYTGNALEENYVSIGDQVAIIDLLHIDEISANQPVDIDGTVLLPELGTVHVAGMTRSELRAVLTERYANYYTETDIQVRIETRAKKYFVFGEVDFEGEHELEGDLTLLEAITRAKPNDDSANLGRIRLIKADPVDPLIIPVNMNDILERGDATFNIPLEENDIIYVPPTLLAQFAYFLNDLLFPVREVLRGIGGALFGAQGVRNNNRNSLNSAFF